MSGPTTFTDSSLWTYHHQLNPSTTPPSLLSSLAYGKRPPKPNTFLANFQTVIRPSTPVVLQHIHKYLCLKTCQYSYKIHRPGINSFIPYLLFIFLPANISLLGKKILQNIRSMCKHTSNIKSSFPFIPANPNSETTCLIFVSTSGTLKLV